MIKIKDTLSLDIKDLPGEIWEEIPGYEDRYLISNYSRVKSIIFKNHIIIKKTLSSGKYKVILSDFRNRRKNWEPARLAASVFLRKPTENEVLRHINGNIRFDAVFNLIWITKKESHQIAFRTGKFPQNHGKAERNGMFKNKKKKSGY